MGNTFARICIGFIKYLFVEEITHGTQTFTNFTGRLTSYDSIDLGSTEIFDQACNICDLYTEKEAVGFCCVCEEQYMCYQCCRHHEKINLSKNHNIVGKEQFGKMRKVTSLFEMRLVPLTTNRLPRCIHGNGKCSGSRYVYYENVRNVQSIFSLQNSKQIFFLMSSKNYCTDDIQLGAVNEDASYKTIARSEDVMTKINATIKYFVIWRNTEIWLMKYNDDKFCYKFLFSTSGKCYGVAQFDNGLAILVYIQTGFSLPDWQIQYVDFKGNIHKQIYYDSHGKLLFKRPDHLASNETEDILFVSDSKNSSVIALDPKGNIIYKFTHDHIKSPTRLTCDEENNVYVACTNKVIQIDQHGEACRILLDSESKVKQITDLFYDRFRRELAVIEASGFVTIFAFLS